MPQKIWSKMYKNVLPRRQPFAQIRMPFGMTAASVCGSAIYMPQCLAEYFNDDSFPFLPFYFYLLLRHNNSRKKRPRTELFPVQCKKQV